MEEKKKYSKTVMEFERSSSTISIWLISLILDLQHEVPQRVENGLDRVLPVARVDEAGGEEILAGGIRILEADLATITARRREGNRSRSC
ncbi:hypothetical protein Vadar_016492 [Vaccinium darrowii]|uniref:Uncharacterized protein n=1 Tax=Vaccinium darrowii TaxID=229202 RepID=A0ACB7XAN2_9ERIC|nr:hypothetical protein Vadar_016492 [Vaccinium darrowii]